MRKSGKFERPLTPKAAVPGKKEKSQLRNMLLRTYFTSLLSLVICVTLFFGTSYAWFTSEVSNGGNEIYVGSLKVGLYNEEEKTRDSLKSKDEKLFDNNIRWEPGYTALEKISIVNEGDLAFKYVLTFTDGKLISGEEESPDYANAAKYFDVWSYYHREGVGPTATSYDQITEENSGWVHAGNLADVLKDGLPVLENNMVTTRYKDRAADSTEPTNPGTTDGIPTTDTYTIALHMNEEVSDSTIMGKIISLNVKLVAYQKPDVDESDGFGRHVYDDITTVNTVNELSEAMKKSSATTKIVLFSDIVGDEKVKNTVTLNGGLLDGNGNNIEKFDMYTLSTAPVDIKNLIVKDAVLTIRGDAVLENCDLAAGSLRLTYLEEGKTVKLVNCKLADEKVDEAVITIKNHVFEIDGPNNLEVKEGMLVWSLT